ncbi:E3 Ubiquitin ligase MUL1-like [Dillenia turbinata]|uniref:RING-type E3 ubiquitin transferase n=1 Tax=Dillenia turbinata TaxID=194707 RepID=A0AAN8ZE95_9MAGN
MLPWGGLSCCLSAAALYLLGRSSGRDAEVLKTVTKVNQLKELEADSELLSESPWYLERKVFVADVQLLTDGVFLDSVDDSFLYSLGLWKLELADGFYKCRCQVCVEEFAQLLDSACKISPLIVSISGRVGSETPINCEHSGLRGVIVEETAEQHFLKHNDAGSWIQDSALMLSMSKEVPWYLVRKDSSSPDDETARVFVVGARSATGLILTVGSEVFEESGRSLVRGTLDYLQGLKMLGVKRIERVLPTGTSLTVVGENIEFPFVSRLFLLSIFSSLYLCRTSPLSSLVSRFLSLCSASFFVTLSATLFAFTKLVSEHTAVKDDIGTIRIQRPHKGPFYASPKTISELIANLGKWARWYKYASMGFTAFGVYLIAKHVIQYLMERKRRWELQKRVLAAAAKRLGQNSEALNGKEENGSESAKKEHLVPDLCVICLEQEYNAVFVPLFILVFNSFPDLLGVVYRYDMRFNWLLLRCGHMCSCMTCSAHLSNCPLCRRRIEQVVRTFRH